MQLITVNVVQVDVEIKARVTTLIAAVKELQGFGVGRNGGYRFGKWSEGGSPLDGCQRIVIAPHAGESVSQHIIGIVGRGITF